MPNVVHNDNAGSALEFPVLLDLISRIRCNDYKTKEIHLNCSELMGMEVQNISQHHTHSFHSYIGRLTFALRYNNIVESVRIDQEFIQVLNKTSARFLWQSICRLPNLKHLSILNRKKDDSSFPVSCLTNILQQSLNLVSLDLHNLELSGSEEETSRLCDTLLVLSCTTLTKFQCFQLQFSNKCFKMNEFLVNSILKLPSRSSLTDVQIFGDPQDISISSETIRTLCHLPSLASLALIDLNLGQGKIIGLQEALLDPNCHLQSLNLCNNSICDVGCIMIVTALLQNSTAAGRIEELYLGNNKLTKKSALALSTLLESSSVTSLKALNLNTNTLGMTGMKALGRSLMINSSLANLQLSNCKINTRGIAYISDALYTNKSLRELNIKYNNISDIGYEQLTKAVESNLFLQEVKLDTFVPRKLSTKIQFYCSMNKSGRRKLHKESMDKRIVVQVLNKSQKHHQQKVHHMKFEKNKQLQLQCDEKIEPINEKIESTKLSGRSTSLNEGNLSLFIKNKIKGFRGQTFNLNKKKVDTVKTRNQDEESALSELFYIIRSNSAIVTR